MATESEVVYAKPDQQTLRIISGICRLAGPLSIFDDLKEFLTRHRVVRAVRRHDTEKIFDWLMFEFSQQGISDRAAHGYIAKHGNLRFAEIRDALKEDSRCPKLEGHWAFERCGYRKLADTCNEPTRYRRCPLPNANLRNGRLNQLGYALYFFIRDVAQGDLVAWIDGRLDQHIAPTGHSNGSLSRLIEPMRSIYGVSDKVLSMALSALLLGTGNTKPTWMRAGTDFVVVDRLVHNFLVRTGILARAGADHLYGPNCYGPNGCAAHLKAIATRLDARTFNQAFPACFPRFIQLAIWRYCAEGALNVCNSRKNPSRKPCRNVYCALFTACERRPLAKTGKNVS